MAGGFDTRIEVDDRLSAPFKRLREAGGDMRAPFADISEDVQMHTLERYKRQVSPDDVPWKRRKKSKDAGRPVLWLHGDLYNAIERESGDDFAAIGVLRTGAPAEYAAIHQFGGDIENAFGKGVTVTIPARPYLGIEERDISSVEMIIIEHLRRAAAGGAASGKGAA